MLSLARLYLLSIRNALITTEQQSRSHKCMLIQDMHNTNPDKATKTKTRDTERVEATPPLVDTDDAVACVPSAPAVRVPAVVCVPLCLVDAVAEADPPLPPVCEPCDVMPLAAVDAIDEAITCAVSAGMVYVRPATTTAPSPWSWPCPDDDAGAADPVTIGGLPVVVVAAGTRIKALSEARMTVSPWLSVVSVTTTALVPEETVMAEPERRGWVPIK